MVTLNSVQLLIKKRTFSVSFTLSVKGKINNKHNKKRKEEKESKKVSKQERKREFYIEQKVFLTCCFSGTVCHKKIKIETKNDCLLKSIFESFSQY